MVTYFGIAETSGVVTAPTGTDAFSRPIYTREQPRNFLIVVEAKRGPNNLNVGSNVFNYIAGDADARPDLQIQSDRNLGDGSSAVCDSREPTLGGVPGIGASCDPVCAAAALNDFACRFVVHTRTDEACTLSSGTGLESYVSSQSVVQFCFEPSVGAEVAFPPGDTVLTVRVRNVSGGLGDPRQIVVRVP